MIATKDDILQCQFSNWYASLVGKTFKSRVIPLPTEFITYLGEDGVILPKSSKAYFNNDVLSDDEEDKVTEIEEHNDTLVCAHDFSELESSIYEAIQELQGEVMVKLNWSAPIDAVWANAGSLKCRSASDIYVLLKSSDRVTFDLEKMFDLCSTDTDKASQISTSTVSDNSETKYTLAANEYTLVLRKWANLNPAMEFRVFIKDRDIVGICQRDCCTYYDFLEAKVDEVQDSIYDFFYGTPNDTKKYLTSVGVRELFPLSSYVMDVYMDLKSRVWLVDFNPFGEPTCALLYEWEELLTFTAPEAASVGGAESAVLESEAQLCEFRIVESAGEVLQSSKGSSRGPIDVHAASEFRNFMDLCKAQQAEDSDDSSTE